MASFIFDQWQQAALIGGGPDLQGEYGVDAGGMYIALIKGGGSADSWEPTTTWATDIWSSVPLPEINNECVTTGYTQYGARVTSDDGTDDHAAVATVNQYVNLNADDILWDTVTFTPSGTTQGPRYALAYWRDGADMADCIPVALFDFGETVTVDDATLTIDWINSRIMRVTCGNDTVPRMYPGFWNHAMRGDVDLAASAAAGDLIVRLSAITLNWPLNSAVYWTSTHTSDLEHAEGGSNYTRGAMQIGSFMLRNSWVDPLNPTMRLNYWGPDAATHPYVQWPAATITSAKLYITDASVDSGAPDNNPLIVCAVAFNQESSSNSTFRVTWNAADGILVTSTSIA